MGVMTGGGFGSVDLKVKNGIIEVETSESSSYIAGNYAAYEKIANIIENTVNSSNSFETLEKLKQNLMIVSTKLFYSDLLLMALINMSKHTQKILKEQKIYLN